MSNLMVAISRIVLFLLTTLFFTAAATVRAETPRVASPLEKGGGSIFWHEDFSTFDPAPYYIEGTTGSAVEDGDSFLLTQDAASQRGRIFLTAQHLMVEFLASFSLYLGSGDGADGAAFVWCPTYDYPPHHGGTLDATCAGGFVVAFDTFEGGVDRVYVARNSTADRIVSADVSDLEDDAWHSAEVLFVEGAVTVFLDGIAVISNETIPGYAPFAGFFGFSAATGLYGNEHRVDDIEVAVPSPNIFSDGFESGSTGAWSRRVP